MDSSSRNRWSIRSILWTCLGKMKIHKNGSIYWLHVAQEYLLEKNARQFRHQISPWYLFSQISSFLKVSKVNLRGLPQIHNFKHIGSLKNVGVAHTGKLFGKKHFKLCVYCEENAHESREQLSCLDLLYQDLYIVNWPLHIIYNTKHSLWHCAFDRVSLL